MEGHILINVKDTDLRLSKRIDLSNGSSHRLVVISNSYNRGAGLNRVPNSVNLLH